MCERVAVSPGMHVHLKGAEPVPPLYQLLRVTGYGAAQRLHNPVACPQIQIADHMPDQIWPDLMRNGWWYYRTLPYSSVSKRYSSLLPASVMTTLRCWGWKDTETCFRAWSQGGVAGCWQLESVWSNLQVLGLGKDKGPGETTPGAAGTQGKRWGWDSGACNVLAKNLHSHAGQRSIYLFSSLQRRQAPPCSTESHLSPLQHRL
jgi:hypothetical protein